MANEYMSEVQKQLAAEREELARQVAIRSAQHAEEARKRKQAAQKRLESVMETDSGSVITEVVNVFVERAVLRAQVEALIAAGNRMLKTFDRELEPGTFGRRACDEMKAAIAAAEEGAE